MRWGFLLVACIVTVAPAFRPAPIRWGGRSGKRLFLASKGSLNRASGPQQLMVREAFGNMFSDGIPYFKANPDSTITCDEMRWCLEANGTQSGVAVRVNRCTGRPTQKWNWLPWGSIQLQGTNQCIDVNHGAGLTGSQVKLRECEYKASTLWAFEDAIPLPARGPSQRLAPSIFYLAVVGVAVTVTLRSWMWRLQMQARMADASAGCVSKNVDQGGVCLIEPLVVRQRCVPLTVCRIVPAPQSIAAVPQRRWDPNDLVMKLPSAGEQHINADSRSANHSAISSASRFQEAAGVQFAQDEGYANAVRSYWLADAAIEGAHSLGPFECAPLVYTDGNKTLHGRLVKPSHGATGAGVLVVHTAVGPRDICLHWRAESLAALGYTVLIADMFGDETGLGWEPTWRASAQQELKHDRALGQRRLLAALTALASVSGVDSARIGAIGFCFGGRAVLDLARLGRDSGVRAVVSFHGILDDGGDLPTSSMADPSAPRILICHGEMDPFIAPDQKAACERSLREAGARWELLVFDGVKHGFTNPAQKLNENISFDFDEHASHRSWQKMTELFSETL